MPGGIWDIVEKGRDLVAITTLTHQEGVEYDWPCPIEGWIFCHEHHSG